MFIPKKFQITDFHEISQFVSEHPFAIIISEKEGRPIATHIPLQLQEIEGKNYVTGHLAHANEQWKTFKSVEQVLVIFQGPHSYVSSSWYGHENVPTWNYQSIHIYGKAQLMKDRKSTRLNSSHVAISYAVFCLKKKKQQTHTNLHRTTRQY